MAKGKQVPSRSLHSVDDSVCACASAQLSAGDVDCVVEIEVSLKELDALTHKSRSLVAFNFDHADLVVQVVDVVEVRGLVTDHQVDRPGGLALTRSSEVSLTHLATTVNSKRRNVFILVVPASNLVLLKVVDVDRTSSLCRNRLSL